MKVLGYEFLRRRTIEAREAAQRLRALNVFPGASAEDLLAIAKAGRLISTPAGWSLMVEKTPADKSYVLLEGSASVQKDHRELATIEPGELVGELALLHHKLRSATVVATSPLHVLHFTRDAVEKLVDEVKVFREAVERNAAAHSRRDSEQIV